ncbi:hypothetical protein AVEN_270693-1 [Araneus ventricosus]|uniref:Uncharacterized protein n=1 Tax=Araneus ventricosus TaxID=182803 RepID=A0A4Y2FVQ8_ARAVE|nr:hypothetical protein AVEN_270693-1 [Araneus ventricosus]
MQKTRHHAIPLRHLNLITSPIEKNGLNSLLHGSNIKSLNIAVVRKERRQTVASDHFLVLVCNGGFALVFNHLPVRLAASASVDRKYFIPSTNGIPWLEG